MRKQKDKKFDILFLCHEKDKNILKHSIKHVEENIVGYRKIFVVSKRNFFSENKNFNFIDENIFPFNKEMIRKYAPRDRAGWYFQQFLKLYFLNVTGKEVLDNILVIDADVIFIKKTKFFENGKPLYNFEVGYHQPYYEILEKVFGFGKQNSHLSGTTHHMLFQRKYINEILKLKSKKGGKEFWKAIMENIDKETEAGFSEQDLYFNYMLKYHPDKIKIRKIKFIDFPYYGHAWLRIFEFLGYSYLASHEYFKEQKFSALKSLVIEFLKLIGLKRFVKKMLIKVRLMEVR